MAVISQNGDVFIKFLKTLEKHWWEGRTLISGTQLSKAPERKPRDAEGDHERGQAPERRKSHLIQQTIENGINPPLLLSHGTCGQSKKQHRLKP